MTHAGKVALELRKMILGRVIAPDERIAQEEISKILGVSKIPFREALKILEAEGLVYSVPYKGAFVTNISLEYIEETYFLRSILEEISCAQATVLLTKEAIEQLEEIIDHSEQAFYQNDEVAFIEYLKKFHSFIHGYSGYLRLRQMIDSLRSGIVPHNHLNFKEQGRRALNEHLFIFEKMKQRDSQGAGNAMRMHLQRTGMDVIQQLIEQNVAKKEACQDVDVR